MGFISIKMIFLSGLLRLRITWFLVIALLFLTSANSFATHLRAGNILVENVSPGGCGTDFRITILVYTKDTGNPGDVLFGGDGAVLDFGDGNTVLVPYVENTIIDQPRQIAYAKFVVERYHYAGYRRYTISYREPNRNGGVLNMNDSEHTEFYLETTLTLDPSTACNKPPTLGIPPIDRGCKGIAWFHNPGAVDPDGRDSLTYALVTPFQDRDLAVVDYKDPSDKKFYNNYETANETGNGRPSFKINSRDGTITWDAPGAIGEYNIAFVVIELREIKGTWREMTRIRRDMQIIIEDCDDKRPDLTVPQDTCVEAGTLLEAEITGFDQDIPLSPVKLEGFSEVFNTNNPEFTPAKLFNLDGSAYNADFAASTLKIKFKWQTECAHVRNQPYEVVFKVTEETQHRLASFKTWFIKVVGPAPKWENIAIVPSRNVNLKWENYKCPEADSLQIWRRVDSVTFKPNNCQTGMPGLGYELIAQIPLNASVTEYLDTNNGKGLAPGAMYCYRLVAKYPKGGESYVSKDTCIGPILSKAPIITNVTVDTTDVAAGKITIKWLPPPPSSGLVPTSYSLYRGLGFSGARSATPIFTGNSLNFTDTGLNTKENVYNYQVVALDNDDPVDTSAVASSVRLETTSEIKKIQLQWTAQVPWSIESQEYPMHKIYRGPAGASAISQMELIDSVQVINDGLVYIDSGQYKSLGLNDATDYCYIVKTLGTYGSDDIDEPLINFSQAICSQTGDSIPPCKLLPPLRSTLDYIDCDDYFKKFGCQNQEFRNVITWNKPEDEECRDDIFGYRIYSASSVNGIYLEIKDAGIIRDTVYVDSLGTSFARCYKVAAVDRSGNIGELSDPMCVDNCPYYELPNVFTPDNDIENCNEKFSAFSDREVVGETGSCFIIDKTRCPRFVKSVVFRVYNRWGKEVYNYTGSVNSENTIYIDWDGRDNNGVELSSAVYYYMAEVTFEVVDPSQQTKIYKGWVHLIR
jgi:hypothetical protein